MPDLPALRLVKVGRKGFNVSLVTGWEPFPEDGSGILRVYFSGGDCLEFEGAEARAVRWHLENQAKELPLDRENGQRAEPASAAVDLAVERAGIRSAPIGEPPRHGERPDPAAVLAASAAGWRDPDCEED